MQIKGAYQYESVFTEHNPTKSESERNWSEKLFTMTGTNAQMSYMWLTTQKRKENCRGLFCVPALTACHRETLSLI